MRLQRILGCAYAASTPYFLMETIVISIRFAEVAAVGGIVLSLAPGVPVSVFVATISFVIYLFCWLMGRRRETSA